MNGPEAPDSMSPVSFSLRDGRGAVLRLVTEEDAEELLEFFPRTHTESEFLNWFPGEFEMTLEQEREFIRDHTNKRGAIAVAAIVGGRIVACGGATPAKHRRFAHQTEIGLTVARAFWRQGIGRKITEYLVEWGRRQGLRKMLLRVFADNVRAIPLYESLGFVEEGRLKGDGLRADGTYRDTILMSKFYVE